MDCSGGGTCETTYISIRRRTSHVHDWLTVVSWSLEVLSSSYSIAFQELPEEPLLVKPFLNFSSRKALLILRLRRWHTRNKNLSLNYFNSVGWDCTNRLEGYMYMKTPLLLNHVWVALLRNRSVTVVCNSPVALVGFYGCWDPINSNPLRGDRLPMKPSASVSWWISTWKSFCQSQNPNASQHHGLWWETPCHWPLFSSQALGWQPKASRGRLNRSLTARMWVFEWTISAQ